MARSRYIKTTSNYVLKKKHQETSLGTVYEQNFMTINEMNNYAPGQVPVYSDSNFKFTVRSGLNSQKKYSKYNWLKQDVCGDDPTVWTIDCIPDTTQSPENKIVLKPNTTSLLDFAYYGSCEMLIRASIRDIITKFPGELYLTDMGAYYIDEETGKNIRLGGDSEYLLDNPYLINLDIVNLSSTNILNPLRYFCLTSTEYNAILSDGKTWGLSWEVCEEPVPVKCPENEDILSVVKLTIAGQDILIKKYYVNGEYISTWSGSAIFKKAHIRPLDTHIDAFYDGLDDFEKVLLNRKSVPLYKAVLDTPRETDYGTVQERKEYVWPTRYGWNLDITSGAYQMYVGDLLALAEYYDEKNTDNIWRSLTHESIKNLDWTLLKSLDGTITDEYTEWETQRIGAILRIWGRQYDDLIRYARNIKDSQTVSYNQRNNMPDYTLSDSLDLAGWEAKSVAPTQNKAIYTDSLYDGESFGYNEVDTNSEFARRLRLNSKFLMSLKGTRRGIEAMLSMFGFTPDEYEIKEYVEVAKPNTTNATTYPSYNDIVYYNRRKDNFQIGAAADSGNLLYGLPLESVTVMDDDTKSYVIPWFDKKMNYDGGIYFQMKGGWGRSDSKPINFSMIENIDTIEESDALKLYDETQSYLRFAGTLYDLFKLTTNEAYNGIIYYVDDITDITDYTIGDLDTAPITNFSHYFILVNEDHIGTLGYNEKYKEYGWRNITIDEILAAKTDDARRVIYLESIVSNTKGNNPHAGNGEYDMGEEYLEYYRMFFKNAIETDNLSIFGDDEINKIKGYGFKLDEQEDNVKCWYFTNTTDDSSQLKELSFNETTKRYDATEPNFARVGKERTDGLRKTNLEPFNMETSYGNIEKCDEAAANSIINTKKLFIDFKLKTFSSTGDQYRYINNVVMHYVKQMVPATTLLEYHITQTGIYTLCETDESTIVIDIT